MTDLTSGRARGWTLALVCITALVLGAVAIYAAYDGSIDGVRRVIRVTAHTSLAFFLPAFMASALWRLKPSPATAWLVRHRRELGVTFAASHIIHGAAIVTLAVRDPALFWQLSSIGNIAAGGSAYVFILAMLVTSFDGPRRAIGPKAWNRLHKAGAWYIWISFIATNGKRIGTGPGFYVTVAILLIAGAVRLAAWMKARRIEPERAEA
ncbi:MAG: hypothetical protein QM698_14700 [Micropepsaceae bacterium]